MNQQYISLIQSIIDQNPIALFDIASDLSELHKAGVVMSQPAQLVLLNYMITFKKSEHGVTKAKLNHQEWELLRKAALEYACEALGHKDIDAIPLTGLPFLELLVGLPAFLGDSENQHEGLATSVGTIYYTHKGPDKEFSVTLGARFRLQDFHYGPASMGSEYDELFASLIESYQNMILFNENSFKFFTRAERQQAEDLFPYLAAANLNAVATRLSAAAVTNMKVLTQNHITFLRKVYQLLSIYNEYFGIQVNSLSMKVFKKLCENES